jgi:uncharacterized membrane protein
MDGYAIIGLTLFFTTVLLLGYFLWHTHRMKKNLHDEEIKRAARIMQLRNAALIIGMFAISVFFILLSSMPLLNPNTEEYTIRDNASTYAFYVGTGLLAIAVSLTVVSRIPAFNFTRQVRRHAVKEKLVAMLKFRSRAKPKRSTRV